MENWINIHLGSTVISFGLILDIVGVCLIYRYGLPEQVSRTGANFLELEQPNEADIQKATEYDQLSKIGLSCLIIGFTAQLLGNWL